MQKFVAIRNIERWTLMLAQEEDPAKRQVLETLIAEERSRLAALAAGPEPVPAAAGGSQSQGTVEPPQGAPRPLA